MTITEHLKNQIRKERQQREACVSAPFTDTELLVPERVLEAIRRGEAQLVGLPQALESLIFFAAPGRFCPVLSWLEQTIRQGFDGVGAPAQEHALRFLAGLTLALSSFLPRWNLQSATRHGAAALTDGQIAAAASEVRGLAVDLAARAPDVSARLLAEWRKDAAARLKAESAPDPAAEAQALVGGSVGEYLANLSAELARSNLRRITEMRLAGQTPTEISNDYAAFLPYALYLGASFVTCNPTLVDIAWAADPDYWTPIVDGIIAADPCADADALARLVTLEIVLTNMRLLRPIFLLTEGDMGCVSLQVNPQRHGDAATMIADAHAIYAELQRKLDGGIPNVVFKLPATKAGLEACSALTKCGIGVTITVNFGLFQHLRFAEMIHEGQAIFATLAHMSGRLAYPVRDELLAKLDELSRHGIDEARAREAAAWSGVAVLKKLYALMAKRGYDFRRIRPLIASLRIYEVQTHEVQTHEVQTHEVQTHEVHGYELLPSAFPDITEAVGTRIITVFPNVRRAFDRKAGITLEPLRIKEPTPAAVLEVLTHSEIFKQAYYAADRAWGAAEDERFRPQRVLTLEDEDAVAAWAPVRNTLAEFNNSYDSLVKRIVERKRALAERSTVATCAR